MPYPSQDPVLSAPPFAALAAGGDARVSTPVEVRFTARPQPAAGTGTSLHIGLIGPGNVGRALLAQLHDHAAALHAREGIRLQLTAIAGSRRMQLFDAEAHLHAVPDNEGGPTELDAFAAHLLRAPHRHALLVDCSGSDAVASRYAGWLRAGLHVVTPSKHAGSGDWARYASIAQARRDGGRFLYEATVGAGLPVIGTLRSLLDTGDTLLGIEGMLSGTLSWLFNRFDGSAPFSALVREAQALGYTEPDPRDDLSGMDVARKLVILAREAGLQLSLADVDVESLVPPVLRDVPRDDFLARLHELDAPMQARLEAARAQDLALRYVAALDCSSAPCTAKVGMVALPSSHACRHARLTDNLVQFRTRRYADNPLVVQGPGAGPQVTAAGVFADMLSIARSVAAGAERVR